MKALILILTILSFFQSAALSLDLVLVVLICRSYLKPDKTNLYLAFGFGLLSCQLSLSPFGVQSLIYLGIVAIVESLSLSRLAGNSIMIIPLTFILVSINKILLALISSHSINLFPMNLIETLLSFPLFYLIRLWEERFIVRKEIKLRI